MIHFSRAGENHMGALLELLPLYYECDDLPYDKEKAKHGLKMLLDDSSLGEIWLIEDTDLKAKAIGYMILAFGFSLECGGKEAFIDELFILEKFRGKGIGTRAIQHAIARCQENRIQAMRLEVTRGNEEALSLYNRAGFEDLGRYLLARRV